MREIKFRAWDNGKMHYQVRCGGIFDDIPTAPTVWNEDAGDWLNLTGQPHTKVMQYTGLKDKNGREICEGDIIMYNEGSTESRSRMEVKWCNASYQLKAYKENWCYDLGECLQSTLEIIGNIFENPELLEVNDDV